MKIMDIKIKYAIIAFIVILLQSSLKLIGVILTGSLSFLSMLVKNPQISNICTVIPKLIH